MTEAVHHIDAVATYSLGGLHLHRFAQNPILVLETHLVAAFEPVASGDVGVEPDFVGVHHLGQQRVGLGAAERVDRGAAIEQTEGAGRWLRWSLVPGNGIESRLGQLW